MVTSLGAFAPHAVRRVFGPTFVCAWRRCAREAGLRVETICRTPSSDGIVTPENNVLILRAA